MASSTPCPISRVGRPPTCECGVCPKCRHRTAARQRYQGLSIQERRAIVLARDKDKVRANDRARYQRDPRKRHTLMDDHKRRHPGRVAARRAVANALKRGALSRGLCEMTDDECRGQIEAHHDDYSKHLEVRWLCKEHHERTHHDDN